MRFPWLLRMVFVTVSPAYAVAFAALAISAARGNARKLPFLIIVTLLSIHCGRLDLISRCLTAALQPSGGAGAWADSKAPWTPLAAERHLTAFAAVGGQCDHEAAAAETQRWAD
jgi:hypothetical protein